MSNLVNESMTSKILKSKKFWSVLMCAFMIITFSVVSYAAPTTAEDKINELTKMIADVFQKIAGVIIFIGALQVAWAIKSESPDAKSQGLKTIAAGVLVVAVATGYTTFTN
jgi:hypothetical protein